MTEHEHRCDNCGYGWRCARPSPCIAVCPRCYRRGRPVHWCCAVCALMALAIGGCAQVTSRTIRLDVPRGKARLVSVRTTPAWQFWDKPARAWVVNQDGRVEFMPITAMREDLLGELGGPLGSVASHVMIPIAPAP